MLNCDSLIFEIAVKLPKFLRGDLRIPLNRIGLPRELVLRIRNILGRQEAAERGDERRQTIRFGGFRFDPVRAELFRGEAIVHLTAAEAALLLSLAARAPDAVSREDLSQSAQFHGNIRNVDVQMTRLRRKIELDPRYPRYLQTVRGIGYALKPE